MSKLAGCWPVAGRLDEVLVTPVGCPVSTSLKVAGVAGT
jgi:hypothetical protein